VQQSTGAEGDAILTHPANIEFYLAGLAAAGNLCLSHIRHSCCVACALQYRHLNNKHPNLNHPMIAMHRAASRSSAEVPQPVTDTCATLISRNAYTGADSVACIQLWSLHEQPANGHKLRGCGVVSLLYLLACIRTDLDESGTPDKSNSIPHILDVTLQEHRPFGEPMTGSLHCWAKKQKQSPPDQDSWSLREDRTISTTRSHLADHHKVGQSVAADVAHQSDARAALVGTTSALIQPQCEA
jgi:hypothetical protein